ncbi:hypothetical protein [Rubrobacter indicoceani]|uniref:hypothetical protein n=1 Tax=Rubrobacter indicoceani TaxID=2051957 RepID=UPI0013C4BCEF|nr:hypothetical protein [Rubrobacter indicoceani]
MTDVREELRPRDGEAPREWDARVKAIHERERASHEKALEDKRSSAIRPGSVTSVLNVESAIGSRERQAEGILERFETAEKRLYKDDRPLYNADEHTARLGELRLEAVSKLEGVILEADRETERIEREVKGLSYQDPTLGLTAPERERLPSSAALIAEDVRSMDWTELAERLEAVESGEDRVAQILHLRSGTTRLSEEETRLGELARRGQSSNLSETNKQSIGRIRTALGKLNQRTEDPKSKEQKERAQKVLESTRKNAARLRQIKSRIDGREEQARAESERRARESF